MTERLNLDTHNVQSLSHRTANVFEIKIENLYILNLFLSDSFFTFIIPLQSDADIYGQGIFSRSVLIQLLYKLICIVKCYIYITFYKKHSSYNAENHALYLSHFQLSISINS